MYTQQEISSAQSARVRDINGWPEIKRNPLSKAGVFPYLGRSIDPTGRLGLDPEKVYQVYRPAEELADPACIESFKLIPWVLGHTMLGESAGVPAEEKGIHGITGEQIFFEKDTLFGNIKIFSEVLEDRIDAGEKELSLGYRCFYEISSGIFENQRYDVIQRRIRGNHMATVPEGRMGPEVAVLDHMTSTFDAKDIIMPQEIEKEAETKKEMTLSEITAKLEEIVPEVQKLMGFMAKLKPLEEAEHGEKLAGEAADAEGAEAEKKDEKKEDGSAMDAAEQIRGLKSELATLKAEGTKSILSEISRRNELAEKISEVVGVFDHAEKTVAEVAAYGVSKLGISCEKGQEVSALNGFFQARKASAAYGHGMDSACKKSDELTKYLKG